MTIRKADLGHVRSYQLVVCGVLPAAGSIGLIRG